MSGTQPTPKGSWTARVPAFLREYALLWLMVFFLSGSALLLGRAYGLTILIYGLALQITKSERTEAIAVVVEEFAEFLKATDYDVVWSRLGFIEQFEIVGKNQEGLSF